MPTISGTMHLKIIKGIAKTPGDTQSAEQGLDEINLLDPAGFSCDEYQMRVPALKSSAIYADSPITDGRTLISGALDNVKETMRITLNATTIIQLAAMLSKLGRMRQDCNDFWDTYGQIEPVYLKHQIVGEPGPRYALLYDIDVDVETPINPNDTTRTVTFNIEREYGWRGIAPGDNPKKWTYYTLSQSFNNTVASLSSASDHIATQNLNNRREWNSAQTALLSQNHIDIAASRIPGDLPALTYIYAQLNTVPNIGVNGVYIARTSKPDLITDTGVTWPPNYILNACDGAATGTDTTTAADTGAPLNSSGTGTRGRVTFATVTADAMRFQWIPSIRGYFDFSIMRGKFAAFVRARLSASGTVALHLNIESAITTVSTTAVNLTDQGGGGTGNTTSWGWCYLGQITLPFTENQIAIGDDGLGTEVITTGTGKSIQLSAARTSGTPELYVSDLVLLPIDECAGFVEAGTSDNLGNGQWFVYDNTGYYLHGKPGAFTKRNAVINTGFSGQEITLAPNRANRLHFIMTGLTGSTQRGEINLSIPVKIDIVPRWAGLRDA